MHSPCLHEPSARFRRLSSRRHYPDTKAGDEPQLVQAFPPAIGGLSGMLQTREFALVSSISYQFSLILI